LAWVSEPASTNIRVVARNKSLIFAADDDGIEVLNFNGTHLKRLLHKKLQSKVKFLISMGDILVCIEKSGLITIVDVISEETLVEIETPSSFVITSAIHPVTYYNKVGSELLQLLFIDRSWLGRRTHSNREHKHR
jgi:hypothetical protein